MLPSLVLTDSARVLFPKLSRATFDSAHKPAQMPGDCDQQDRGKRKQDISDALASVAGVSAGKYATRKGPKSSRLRPGQRADAGASFL